MRAVRDQQGVKMYMDWHSYSQLWMTPYGYTCSTLPAANAELQSISGGAVAAIEAVYGTQLYVVEALLFFSPPFSPFPFSLLPYFPGQLAQRRGKKKERERETDIIVGANE